MKEYPPTKICTDCKQELDISNFRPRSNGRWLRSYCKTCANIRCVNWHRHNRDKSQKMSNRYYHENTSKVAQYWLKHRYGISLEQYKLLVEAQDGRCGICQRECKKLHVDHDHITNKIRGLLCFHCNAALGKFGDSIEGLERAIQYLRKS